MLKTPLQDPRNIGSTAWGCNHVSEGLPVHETLLKSTARLLEPMFTQLNLWKYCFLYAVLSLVFTVHCKCHILKCCNHLNRIIALTRRDLVNYTSLVHIFLLLFPGRDLENETLGGQPKSIPVSS